MPNPKLRQVFKTWNISRDSSFYTNSAFPITKLITAENLMQFFTQFEHVFVTRAIFFETKDTKKAKQTLLLPILRKRRWSNLEIDKKKHWKMTLKPLEKCHSYKHPHNFDWFERNLAILLHKNPKAT